MASRPTEIFVSYCDRNKKFVQQLTGVLRDNGHEVFWSADSIHHGASWLDVLVDALSRCDWFLLVISPQAVTRRWVKTELRMAMNMDRYEDRITPCWWRRTELVSPFQVVNTMQSVSFIRNKEAGFQKLLSQWK